MSSATGADERIWTIGQLLEWTTGFFQRKQLETPRLDAEILLAHVLTCKRIELYMQYDAEVNGPDRRVFRELVVRRGEDCPLAYLVEEKEFYGRAFFVNADVLIPRPETELLIDAALAFAEKSPVHRFLDIGVGSGAIAVTLSTHWPVASGFATDVSEKALAVAQRNADRHGVAGRLTLAQGADFATIPKDPFDLIVSNPPYISAGEFEALPQSVRGFEPKQALLGGANGTEMIARLIQGAESYLRVGGQLMLEIGAGQKNVVGAMFDKQSGFRLLEVKTDANRIPRLVVAERV